MRALFHLQRTRVCVHVSAFFTPLFRYRVRLQQSHEHSGVKRIALSADGALLACSSGPQAPPTPTPHTPTHLPSMALLCEATAAECRTDMHLWC